MDPFDAHNRAAWRRFPIGDILRGGPPDRFAGKTILPDSLIKNITVEPSPPDRLGKVKEGALDIVICYGRDHADAIARRILIAAGDGIDGLKIRRAKDGNAEKEADCWIVYPHNGNEMHIPLPSVNPKISAWQLIHKLTKMPLVEGHEDSGLLLSQAAGKILYKRLHLSKLEHPRVSASSTEHSGGRGG